MLAVPASALAIAAAALILQSAEAETLVEGGVVTSTAQLAFPGATLADLDSNVVRARMQGAQIDDDGVEASAFLVASDSSSRTFQFEAIDISSDGKNKYSKATRVVFTQLADGVHAKLAGGNYTNYGTPAQFAPGLSQNASKNNYNVYELALVASPPRSLNVNFANDASHGINTATNVCYGAGDFAVPYSSWVNMIVANNTSASFDGMTATISGTRGAYQCTNLNPSYDIRYGYIDESASYPDPTVTVDGIPYGRYRVVVYMATNEANKKFSHVTINGTDYTGDAANAATVEGSSSWGSTSFDKGAAGFNEGVNYLVSPVLSGETATITGHRDTADKPAYRGCIAAVQVVEYPSYTATIAEAGDYTMATLPWDADLPASLEGAKLRIVANESATLNLESAVSVADLKFEVASGKTLSLSGASASAMYIEASGEGRIEAASANALSGTLSGDGTIAYSAQPSGIVLDPAGWTGTLWLKGCAIAAAVPSDLAVAGSTLRLSGVTGYFNTNPGSSATVQASEGTLELVNDSYSFALAVDNGWSANGITQFAHLAGDGVLGVQTRDISQRYVFTDASDFTGTINLAARTLRVIFGDGAALDPANGTITVASGATATVAAGKTWTASGGIAVDGTLMLGNGATAPAVSSGSGTVGVATGTGTLGGCGANAAPTLATAPDATLAVNDPALASMTIGGFNNLGTIDLRGTALSALTVLLPSGATATTAGTVLYPGTFGDFMVEPADGSIRSLSAFAAPSLPEGARYGVILSESAEEYGKGTFEATDVADGIAVFVRRPGGAFVEATVADGTAALDGGVNIDGAATLLDITFKNNASDAGKTSGGVVTYTRIPGASVSYDSAATFNNDAWDDTTGVYIKHHPWVNNVASAFYALEEFSIVVVGSMSPSHNTIFIHLGGSHDNSSGIIISTTENDDEVLIAMNSAATVDAAGGVKAAVPYAASARHAYVLVKTGTKFDVWVDGVKRGSFAVPADYRLGKSDSSGLQVGSDFGGYIKKANVYKAVGTGSSETGVVNVMRVFDYAVSDAQAAKVFETYPFVSQGGLFTRTVSADGSFSEAGTWAKHGDDAFYAAPEGATVDGVAYNPSATVTTEANATLEVNADATIDTLTAGGAGTLRFAYDGSHSVTVNGAAILNGPVSIEKGAVGLVGVPVQLSAGGSLEFDWSAAAFSGFANLSAAASWQLTGLVDRDDTKVTLVPPASLPARICSFGYNATGSFYEFSVAPDRTASVTVAEHATLAGIANGQLFVPGREFTLTAGGDANYAVTLFVDGVEQASPYTFTASDADISVEVRARRIYRGILMKVR